MSETISETPDTTPQLLRAEEAINAGDFSRAAELLEPIALIGDVAAMAILGALYLEGGHGVAQDLDEAAGWLHAAASQGNAEAQYQLAIMYGRGDGVARDEAAALRWLRAAASGGNPYAEGLLAEYLTRHAHGAS